MSSPPGFLCWKHSTQWLSIDYGSRASFNLGVQVYTLIAGCLHAVLACFEGLCRCRQTMSLSVVSMLTVIMAVGSPSRSPIGIGMQLKASICALDGERLQASKDTTAHYSIPYDIGSATQAHHISIFASSMAQSPRSSNDASEFSYCAGQLPLKLSSKQSPALSGPAGWALCGSRHPRVIAESALRSVLRAASLPAEGTSPDSMAP